MTHSHKPARDYLALALDNYSQIGDIRRLIRLTRSHIGVFKIGLEQFTRFGPALLDEVRGEGRKMFLDLKLHDIPNTVEKAVAAAAEHQVDFLTVHTQGGPAMLTAAAAAAAKTACPPKIIGVTALTSIDATTLCDQLLVTMPLELYVRHLASLAVGAGLDGIVCSAADLPAVKPSLPASFEIITPGVRMAGQGTDDQKRIASPSVALEAGATLLVVGRPITGADDPADAAKRFEACVEEYVGSV